jgi:hypothetical protein
MRSVRRASGFVLTPHCFPTTLGVTGGKNDVRRYLLDLAERCRIVPCGQQNQAISDFRPVLLFATLCRYLLHAKGKKRATSRTKASPQSGRSSFGEGQSERRG